MPVKHLISFRQLHSGPSAPAIPAKSAHSLGGYGPGFSFSPVEIWWPFQWMMVRPPLQTQEGWPLVLLDHSQKMPRWSCIFSVAPALLSDKPGSPWSCAEDSVSETLYWSEGITTHNKSNSLFLILHLAECTCLFWILTKFPLRTCVCVSSIFFIAREDLRISYIHKYLKENFLESERRPICQETGPGSV